MYLKKCRREYLLTIVVCTSVIFLEKKRIKHEFAKFMKKGCWSTHASRISLKGFPK